MIERVFSGNNGVVVAPSDNEVFALSDLRVICETYGGSEATSGFLLNATIAGRANGLAEAVTTVDDNSHARVITIYETTATEWQGSKSCSGYARWLGDCGVSGAIIRTSSEFTIEQDAGEVIGQLQTSQVGPIVDLGIPQNAKTFNVDEVWSRLVDPSVDRGVQAFVANSDALVSVRSLSERLANDVRVGVGRYAILAPYSDSGSLLDTISATGGNLHVIVPSDIRYGPRISPQPSRNFQAAQFAMRGYDGLAQTLKARN